MRSFSPWRSAVLAILTFNHGVSSFSPPSNPTTLKRSPTFFPKGIHRYQGNHLLLHHGHHEENLPNLSKPLETVQPNQEEPTNVPILSSGAKQKPFEVMRSKTSEVSTFLRRWSTAMALFLAITFSPFHNNAYAGDSAGLMRGSFGPSQSSQRSTYSPRPSYSSRPSYYSQPSIRSYGQPIYRSNPTIVIQRQTPSYYYAPSSPYVVSRGFSVADAAVLTCAGSLVAYGIVSNLSRRGGDDYDSTNSSVLGPGVTVVSLMVALNVPDRDSPNSILNWLKKQSQVARTDTRAGVQDLVSKTALQLLRNEDSIVSVDSSFKHFQGYKEADREFNRLSVDRRSKFKRETVNVYNGLDRSDASTPGSSHSFRSTTAVVSLILAIEGDSTVLKNIRSRTQLREALSVIAADSKVDDCLQSAEILWAPEERSDTLSSKDVYTDFPTLFPL